MKLENAVVGFACTASFCTLESAMAALEALCAQCSQVVPILSRATCENDTRFGRAADWIDRMQRIAGVPPLSTITEVEPIGPKKLIDILIIAPCTGNTLAKLAAGIADGPVTLAAKAHLRNARPVLIAPSTNDGLSGNARSIGELLNRKNIFFVPFGQDDPHGKPASLVAHMQQIPEAAKWALCGHQMQPMLMSNA